MLLICTKCYVFCYEVLILQRAPHTKFLLGKNAPEPESGRMKMEGKVTGNPDTMDKMDSQINSENQENGNIENYVHPSESASHQEELKKSLSHREW